MSSKSKKIQKQENYGETNVETIDGKLVRAPTTRALPNIWGKKTWAKRTNEPMEAYAIFALYLQDKELRANKWIESLSDSERADFAPGVRDPGKLRIIARDWRWEIRKNDYINQIWEIMRIEEQKQMRNTGALLSELGHEMVGWALDSAKTQRLRGDELTPENQIALMKLGTELIMHSENLEERRKHRISVTNAPTTKIKALLKELKKIEK